jgi:cob(I)alamin adenosyltransferase
MIQFDDLEDEIVLTEIEQRTIDAIKEIQKQLFMFSGEFGKLIQLIGKLEDKIEELEKKIEWLN